MIDEWATARRYVELFPGCTTAELRQALGWSGTHAERFGRRVRDGKVAGIRREHARFYPAKAE